MDVFAKLAQQISGTGLPLYAVTLTAVPHPDTPVLLMLHWAGKLVLPPDAIPDSEKYVALKSVGMLSGLSDAELWELARAGRWRRLGMSPR